jgi:hypothetical protein
MRQYTIEYGQTFGEESNFSKQNILIFGHSRATGKYDSKILQTI